jgi:hypothetical protein
MKHDRDRDDKKAGGVDWTPRGGYRPVDGIVVGQRPHRKAARDIWVLVSRPGEGLMDFFLEDEPTGVVSDPHPQCCLGLGPDGTVTIGSLDWERDQLLSELVREDRMDEAGLE